MADVNLFALPPGVDFSAEVVAGLERRMAGAAPEDWARVTIFVNTRRLGRQVSAAFDAGPARLVPRIRLVAELALDPLLADPRAPASPIGRRLELAQLVGRLLDADPRLAPRSALHDLSDSLARLIDEMHVEGVPVERIAGLRVEDQSGHWARTLQFLDLLRDWTDPERAEPSAALRLREVVERLAERWAVDPPRDPVIVAGSTGSRGATALFMETVARLPKGAVILPGVDTAAPPSVWEALSAPHAAEDHPQLRYARLCARLGCDPAALPRWTDATPAAPERNRLISMALRPAPVTDQWQSEGPALQGIAAACDKVTLIEAPGPRQEAEVIALRLRQAAGEDRRAILITPDRMLTRQVAAALDRWDLTADDSAGLPLPLTPPGRLLRQVADLLGQRLTAEALLALLKHPLVGAGGARGDHLRLTHDLELFIRRNGAPFPTLAGLGGFTSPKGEPRADRVAWLTRLFAILGDHADPAPRPMADHLARHRAMAEALVAGGEGDPAELWAQDAGRAARRLMENLEAQAGRAGDLTPRDYKTLFQGFLAEGQVRNPEAGDPRLLIRGTLEARGETAPLVILAGLNDGIWPPTPGADPWLNRALRAEAGLLLPERQIGLSAHDFMQAAAAEEIWLTRSVRSAEAETVPSRWLNRLTNLLGGLGENGGPEALAAMRQRGATALAQAAALSAPGDRVAPARRPSPRVPVALRPRRFSASAIATLIRDPYAIYARQVLGLSALEPLTRTPDARERGTLMHAILEQTLRRGLDPRAPGAEAEFLRLAEEVIARDCPWPTTRHLWFARIARIATWFLTGEATRQDRAVRTLLERQGLRTIAGLGVEIHAKADRIDLDDRNGAWIYDYKTGDPPGVDKQIAFEKQLLIEAAILEGGGWDELAGAHVAGASYLGLGATPKEVPAPLAERSPGQTWEELVTLIGHWMEADRGYTARIAPERIAFEGDYDHLARRGEWDDTDDASPVRLT